MYIIHIYKINVHFNHVYLGPRELRPQAARSFVGSGWTNRGVRQNMEAVTKAWGEKTHQDRWAGWGGGAVQFWAW